MLRKLAVASATVLVLATGCASQADEATVLTGSAAAAALRAAPDVAADAGSGRFEMTMSFATPDGDVDIVATGVFAGERMRMELDFGAAVAGLGAAGGEAPPPGFDEPMEMIVDGTTAYLRVPMLEMLTGTSGWLRASAEELGASGESFGLGAGASDPSQLLETLRGVAGDVVEVGPEEVRGVSTTRYRATIDLAEALEAAPEAQRERLEAQLDGFGTDGVTLPVEVWIDDDGLPRRMSIDLAGVAEMANELGPGGRASMTIEFFDYGDDITIELPDPADTTAFGDVLGGFGGAG